MVSTSGRIFNAFMGIPFGKVPQRFTDSEPADPWVGDFAAFTNGPMCPQYQWSLHTLLGEEDCLTLNVYTPSTSTGNKGLPVMVYIYGGAYVYGTTMPLFFGPEHFMDKDIVLVAINYRIGLLGFLSTGDDAASGNWGLKDQQLALHWVQDNIEAFGGDKTKVTIFGVSAGASSAHFHLLSPRSQGLFHGAILQSGSALCPWAFDENPLETASTVARQLGCPIDDTTELVNCMRNKPFQDIVTITLTSLNLQVGPAVEIGNSDKSFLSEHPYVLMSEGRINKVPIIIGIVLHECVHLFESFADSFQCTKEEFFESGMKCFLGNVTDKHFVDSQPDLVESMTQEYFSDVDFNDKKAVNMRGIQVASDVLFNGCNDITLKMLAGLDIPVYSYIVDYISEAVGPITTDSGEPDVYHGSDTVFFYNMKIMNPQYSEHDKKLIGEMTTMWTNFAAYYNPTPEGIPVHWNPTTPDVNQFMRLGLHMVMDDNFRNEKIPVCSAFQTKYLKYQVEEGKGGS